MATRPADLRRAILDQAGRGSTEKRARAARTARASTEEDSETAPTVRPTQPGRVGKVSVTGYFAPEVRRQLRRLAADTDTTIQALLGEALNDLFAKHGIPEIADADS